MFEDAIGVNFKQFLIFSDSWETVVAGSKHKGIDSFLKQYSILKKHTKTIPKPV